MLSTLIQSGIVKEFIVGKDTLFSMEMHPRRTFFKKKIKTVFTFLFGFGSLTFPHSSSPAVPRVPDIETVSILPPLILLRFFPSAK